jgi:hypothetical protein
MRFWFLWFWACLLPVSNLIPINTYYADRFLYLPALGLFTMLAFWMVRTADALRARGGGPLHPLPMAALPLAALALLGCFGTLSYQRIDVWRDEVTLWEDTVRKSPNLYTPHLNLGVAYERHGRLSEAAQEYGRAVRIWPGSRATANLRMLQAGLRHSGEGGGLGSADPGVSERSN